MKRRSFWSLLLLVASVALVGVLSIGALTARAELRPAPGPVAGLAADGTVYVTSTTDSFWHLVDPVTFAKLGYDRNNIQWYGPSVVVNGHQQGGLPGTIAPDTVVTPAYQAFADLVMPKVNLVGLISTGAVYVTEPTVDFYWHLVTPAQFVAKGYSWFDVKWYGELPGTIAPDS